jgi:hypothetical protein
MKREQLRAIASVFRETHGAQAFTDALMRARSLTANGELQTGLEWNQIAEEISVMETDLALKGYLETDTRRAGSEPAKTGPKF